MSGFAREANTTKEAMPDSLHKGHRFRQNERGRAFHDTQTSAHSA